MPRIKRGVTSHHKHKKVLAQTKGHIGTKHRLIKRARESMIHSLSYAYFHRRERKGDMDTARQRRLPCQRNDLQPVHQRTEKGRYWDEQENAGRDGRQGAGEL